MLWYCRFQWQSGVSADQVRRRVIEQHEAGTNRPENIRGWYNLAGGGAGFMLVETDSPQELSNFLQPYMDLLGRARRLRAALRRDDRRVPQRAWVGRVAFIPRRAGI
jgi:hypothetical protein